MCGIAGIINKKSDASSMIQKITHRGPDHHQTINLKNASLAFSRLSIIDLSERSNQPLYDAQNQVYILFNGEIYNYLELKQELSKDFEFTTSSDTEVFLKSYIKWGTNCFNKVNGMFAVCFYHADTEKTILARDRFGQKPLFYTQANEEFYFASEIKALPNDSQPNRETWLKYLSSAVYDDDENTFFKNIYQVEPSSYIVLQNSKISKHKYYNISNIQRDYSISYQDAKDNLFNLIQDAIKIHTRSDVPYCLSLSSGFDSSAILASLSDQNLSKEKLNCFTLDFNETLSESIFAKEFSKNWDFKHSVHTILQNDALNMLSSSIYYQESPLGGLLNLGQHYNFQEIHKKGFKVALDGAGVDEVFCGYNTLLQKFENKQHNNFKTQIDGTYSSNADLVIEQWTSGKKENLSLLETQIQYLKTLKLNRGLRMKDRYSMNHSVELRVPFIDHRLVEFGLSLNPSYYFKNGTTKYVIRDAMSKIMPHETCFAKKKSINAPQTKWLQKDPWLSFTKQLINSPSFNDRGLLNADKVKLAHENFDKKDIKNSFYVWQWINMEMWHRIFID